MLPSGVLTRIITKTLSVFFHLLYHQLAWSYDLVAAIVSLGRWQSWIRTVLPYLDESPVLELGHGPGHLQAVMARRGTLVYGLDESWRMGVLAFERVLGLGVVPLLVNGYAQFMPFSNNVFARIVATFPSEYIFDPRTIAEIHRSLLPGGTLVILPLARITGTTWSDRLVTWLFRATRQAPTHFEADQIDVLSRPFGEQGLVVEHTLVDLGTSQVLLILAHKPIEK